MPELLVDARFLEPPEPFVQAMQALDQFDAAEPPEAIRLLLMREPFPLYKVLDEHGYSRQTEHVEDGSFVILIRRASSR
jgi:tRNA 2-thiouridine synthesizing protein A